MCGGKRWIIHNDDVQIAQVFNDSLDDDLAGRDARLIATSKILLEASKQAVEWHDRTHAGHVEEPWVDDLRAAIAAATG
jgi:hypothetical protein